MQIDSAFLEQHGRPGWIGGLMDEYARAAEDLCRVVEATPLAAFQATRPSQDPDCVSIAALCAHVVTAARGYANTLAEAIGQPVEPKTSLTLDAPHALRPALAQALRRTEALLATLATHSDAELEQLRARPRWGLPMYVDLLVEHGIVHLLRHRRQIERWNPAQA